jgi:hypothetical protein
MASAIYPSFKEKILQGQIDLSTVVVRAVLVDTGVYSFSTAHDAYNDLSGIIGTESPAMASKTFTGGTFDAADYSFTSVTGNTAEAIVYFVDSGTTSTDWLIVFVDSGSGLPFTPNGGNLNVTVNGSGIFTL